MAVWQVHEAKKRLREVIGEAENNGPQVITRHGVVRAVILSMRDYRALTAHKPDLKQYLLGGPKVDGFEVNRDGDTGQLPDRFSPLEPCHELDLARGG